MKAQRPFVIVNTAMSADGKIAPASRGDSSFGSGRDHDHLLELRSTADAVMAGARTVDSNPVNMGPGPVKYRQLRKKNGLSEYNLRVVVSGSGSLNPQAEIFRHRFGPVIVLVTQKATQEKVASLTGVGAEVRIDSGSDLNLSEALKWLYSQWKVRRLVCEGGGGLNGAMFRAGLVDELHLTICPLLLGGRDAPTLSDGPGFERLADAASLSLVSRRRIGREIFLVYRRAG